MKSPTKIFSQSAITADAPAYRTKSRAPRRNRLGSGGLLAGGFIAAASTAMLLTGCPGDSQLGADGGQTADMSANSDGGGDMASVLPQLPGCSKDQWCWLSPQPQGNLLRSVWGASGSDVWAVGDDGTTLHNTGQGWQPIVSPTRNSLYAIWGTAANNIFAVGDRATILRYDGSKWTQLSLSPTDAAGVSGLYSIWGSGASDVWFVGASGVAIRWDGTKLTKVNTADKTVLRAIWGTGPTSVYVASAVATGIQVQKWNGSSWAVSGPIINTTSQPTAMWGTADNNYFITTAGSDIWRSDGAMFTRVNPSDRYAVNGLWGVGGEIYAVGDVKFTDTVNKDATLRQGIFMRWNGTTFMPIANAPQVAMYGIWGSSPTDMIAVGASGTVIRYNGAAFSSSNTLAEPLTGVNGPITGIRGTGNSDLVAVGDWGTTMRWNGSNWTSVANDTHLRFRDLSGTDTSMFAAALQDNPMATEPRIFRWTGSAWMTETIPTTKDMRAVWADATQAFAVGVSDTIIRRSGGTWTLATVQNANQTTLRGVYAIDASNIWVVGGGGSGASETNVAVYPPKVLFSANGTAFQPVAVPVTQRILRSVWGSAANDAWIVGDDGTLLRWDGNAWTAVASPSLFSLRKVWGTGKNDVWASGDGGTLMHFDGQTWSLQDTGTSLPITSIWGIGKTVYATGFGGAVLRKTQP